VALLARLHKRHVQTNFQFLGNHDVSFLTSFKYAALTIDCNPIPKPL